MKVVCALGCRNWLHLCKDGAVGPSNCPNGSIHLQFQVDGSGVVDGKHDMPALVGGNLEVDRLFVHQ